MSMLAGPRRRQKISVNPNGADFINDESNIGQKLLKQMGWEKGKGLGTDQQGITKPIKPKTNLESRGLGCSRKHAENWIEHQDSFNDVLATLNQASEQSTTDNNESPKVSKLEEKSKSSRARVHYMKFAKGKDLSRHSEEDIAMILGQRSGRSSPSVSNATSRRNSNEWDKPDPFLSDFSNISTSTLSLQEYFAQKMASRASSNASLADRKVETPTPVSDDTQDLDEKAAFYIGEPESSESPTAPNETYPAYPEDVVVKKVTKKKKKDRNRERHGTGGKVKPQTPPELRENSDVEKDNSDDKERPLNSETNTEDHNVQMSILPTKTNKRKKTFTTLSDEVAEDTHIASTEQVEKSHKKKKKKREIEGS